MSAERTSGPTDWRQERHAPEPGTAVCPLDQLADSDPREFVFGAGSDQFRMIVIRCAIGMRGYVNRCPHFSLPLNHQPGRFHIYGGKALMCAHHSAMFRIADGYCFDGPCRGYWLTAIPLAIRNGQVVISGDMSHA